MNCMRKTVFLLVLLSAWILFVRAENLPVDQVEDYKNLPDFFRLTPATEGMHIEYNGKSPHSRDLFLKKICQLPDSKYIRVTVEFTKLKWNYSSRFMPIVNFMDKKGKLLARYDIDFGYLCAADFSTNWKLGEKQYFFNDFQIPAGAESVQLAINCRGNAFAFMLHNMSITADGKDQSKAFYRRPDFHHEAPDLSRQEVLQNLLSRSPLTVKTIRQNGRIMIEVNGKVIEPVIFKNGPVEGSMPQELKRDATFSKAGFKIFVVNVPFGQTRGRVRGPVWTGENQYDVSQLENAVYDVLAQAPDAYVMLELHVNPYYEWGLTNQDEIYCNPQLIKGLFTSRFVKFSNTPPPKNGVLIWQPSLHSVKFRQDTAKALEEVFRRFAATPAAKATLGVYLNGGIDNQWFSPAHNQLDHSPAAIRSFQEFLRTKYNNDINALRKAWQDNSISSFETINNPTSREIRYPGFVYPNAKIPDFNEFLQKEGSSLFLSFAEAVRRGAGRSLLIGAYWPHGGLSSYPMSEHSNLTELLESDAVDFYAVVPDYYISREPGQARSLGAYNGSLRLHNKLLITELDLRTAEMVNWGMWGHEFYMQTHNAGTFHQDLLSFAVWCRSLGGGFHTYDLTCGFYDTDAAVKSWETAVKLTTADAGKNFSVKPVAVFTEEKSKFFYTQHPSFNTFQYGLREDPVSALRLAGIPYDLYLPSDVFHPELSDCKLLVFADASFMDAATARKIRQVYGNKKRVIVWNYLPGIFSGNNPAEITGFKIYPNPSVDRKPLSIIPGEDPLIRKLGGFNTNISTLRAGIQYAVNDPQAKILAYYRDTKVGAMAVKRYPDHTEVWIGQAGAFTPQFYRNLAKAAGITPVITSDEPTYLGYGMIGMQASYAGEKEFILPEDFASYTVFTGQKPLKVKGNKATFQLNAGETLILVEK